MGQFQVNSKGTQPYICLYSPPNSPPSRLPHNTEQSSLCYTAGPCWLSILNTAVCTSIPHYHFPLPFPSATISSFSKSVTLLLFCKSICIISFQIPHIRDVIWYFSSSVWLTHSVTLSRSIHVAANGIVSFFLVAEQYSGVCVCVFIYVYIHTHIHVYIPYLLYPFLCQWTFRVLPCLGYCKQCCNEHWVYVSFQIMFFSGYMPRIGTAGTYSSSIFRF